MDMRILEKTASGTSLIPIDTRSFQHRTIWVDGEINAESAILFTKQILELNRMDSTEPIKVVISSGGGSVIHGLAMYDAILTSKAPVETYCVGTAYSMAAVLFCAGKLRRMLAHSKVMLHEPLISNGPSGSASSIKSMSDSLQETKEQLNKILAKHTGRSVEEMEEATDHDHYFSAKEAIEFGLADEIVGLDAII